MLPGMPTPPKPRSRYGVWRELRALRTAHDMRPIDLARAANLSKGYVSELENGHKTPSLDVMRRLAHALHVPVYMLERREGAA